MTELRRPSWLLSALVSAVAVWIGAEAFIRPPQVARVLLQSEDGRCSTMDVPIGKCRDVVAPVHALFDPTQCPGYNSGNEHFLDSTPVDEQTRRMEHRIGHMGGTRWVYTATDGRVCAKSVHGDRGVLFFMLPMLLIPWGLLTAVVQRVRRGLASRAR